MSGINLCFGHYNGMLAWDNDQARYRIRKMREDIFLFNWNIDSVARDISLSAARPDKADVWYWKAARTDCWICR